jgi:hypothetical protein
MSMMEDTELSNRIKKWGKVVFDAENHVLSSPRRMRKKGYFGLFFQFLKQYFKFYVLKQAPEEEYFASARKKPGKHY